MRFALISLAAAVVLLAGPPAAAEDTTIPAARVVEAGRLVGLEFTAAEVDTMLPDLADNLEAFLALRALALPNDVPPALFFQPLPRGLDPRSYLKDDPPHWSKAATVTRPDDLNALAFWSVRDLAELLRTRQVTSMELTGLCLARLREFGPRLECVVTLTEERALAAAARADAEIAAGHYRGLLHGIPFGAKDLFAVPGYPTIWGSVPYRDQTIDDTATVITRLEVAGAVLVAKLTLGELAWGDVWFGGMTRNPWNLEQGSSGSSAGSASAVAAGLVPFALGTETLGSIVSPCTQCGCTGLRPTFGRVSRAGAMALSWSMDKVGPICRTVEDCAIVFNTIRGHDPRDQSTVNQSFAYRPEVDLSQLRIGYLAAAFEGEEPGDALDRAVLDVLRSLGAKPVPIALPDSTVGPLGIILSVEAAAAFDELTVSGRDSLLVRQVRWAWPNVMRHSRLVPAVEYVQANRERWRIVQAMGVLMQDIDVYVAPSFGGNNLLTTNLTGHPCVVLPDGFTAPGEPHSVTFIGRLYDEATLLGVARAYQEATDFHSRHPEAFVTAAPAARSIR
jgi:Asp-tRNA(Asn)/Glu-tRNA(Gln) amidotransferase A subunit family amidase